MVGHWTDSNCGKVSSSGTIFHFINIVQIVKNGRKKRPWLFIHKQLVSSYFPFSLDPALLSNILK